MSGAELVGRVTAETGGFDELDEVSITLMHEVVVAYPELGDLFRKYGEARR